MKLGDFSSLVQLGVGLHAGAAFLQLVSELASTPLVRRLERLEAILELRDPRTQVDVELLDEINDLSSDLEIKQVQFFRDFKKFLYINSAIAGILLVALLWISFAPDKEISLTIAWTLSLFSFVPLTLTITLFQLSWHRNTSSIATAVGRLEKRIFGVG